MVSVVPLPAFSQAWTSTEMVSPGRMLVPEGQTWSRQRGVQKPSV